MISADHATHKFCRRASGFILPGVSIGIFLLSAAAWIAVPRWQESQRAARAQETFAALQQFATAFQDYAHARGDWPPANALPGAVPAGMESLSEKGWSKPSPIGGRYVWLINSRQSGERVAAAIGIVSIAGERVTDEFRQLRALLDEARKSGVPASRLRLGYRDEPIFILEH